MLRCLNSAPPSLYPQSAGGKAKGKGEINDARALTTQKRPWWKEFRRTFSSSKIVLGWGKMGGNHHRNTSYIYTVENMIWWLTHTLYLSEGLNKYINLQEAQLELTMVFSWETLFSSLTLMIDTRLKDSVNSEMQKREKKKERKTAQFLFQ